ncbi:MAG: translation initiation factor IF-2 subunit beta [Thermoprotei archaeon]|nr:MAG: translation initiation factor IF-2 subunit beta [Thermoprotei archaeon]RLF25710.1 MAG: translation initiation factor IF-2 subunit beta [Thermoprotei archaeon]
MEGDILYRYEELLKRALEQMPKQRAEATRFEIPKAKITVIGMRTVIHNFKEICERLNREPRHVLRFILRELATAGMFEGDVLVLQGKFSKGAIDRLIEIYAKNYVICPVCGAPDTKLIKEKRLMFMVCEACGAKSSVRPL